jgi:four helix bundle protein
MSHELAEDIKKVIQTFPEGESLRSHLRVSSATIPHNIAASVGKKQAKEKLKHYHQARQASVQFQEHLMLARSFKYIEKRTFEDLAAKAIEAQQLLTSLIRTLSQDVA